MADKKVETTKKQQHLSTSPKEQDQESTETTPPPAPGLVVSGGSSFIPPPLYTPVSLEQQQQQFEALNPKRTRYTAGQWKLLPSPSHVNLLSTESTPSPSAPSTTAAGPTPPPPPPPQPQPQNTAASSSDTTSSPSHSPRRFRSATSGQESGKSESEQIFRQQFRKGKYVSPVWKPNEMLWLARAWRFQYQGGTGSEGSDFGADVAAIGRGKSRADKDKEVAEFLNRHGVNRDAKTAGTKWDNMLGEFRKVYEWERGGDREVSKSYFRLSPYERKLHRLPASFDEEVFEELAQFMGPKMRTPIPRGGATAILPAGSGVGGGGGDDSRLPYYTLIHKSFPQQDKNVGLGLEGSSSLDFTVPLSTAASKEPRRIGKIRMMWEECVNLWGEEGENSNMGRVKIEGTSFLNADELTYLDDSMVVCTMESFEDGPLKGFSVDRFVSGQQVKVFGRRKSSSSPVPSGIQS